MSAFLFWNLKGKGLLREVRALCAEHGVDVLILAEAGPPPGMVLQELNKGQSRQFYLAEKIKDFHYTTPILRNVGHHGQHV
jgi:hypothetical protein